MFPAGSYRSVGTVLANTNKTAVYTCPTTIKAAFVVWVRTSDDASDARGLTLAWYDTSLATEFILGSVQALAANTPLAEELYLALEPGDELRATASAAGMHVTVTTIEITGRNERD